MCEINEHMKQLHRVYRHPHTSGDGYRDNDYIQSEFQILRKHFTG